MRVGLVVTGAGGYLGGRLVQAANADDRYAVTAAVRRPIPWMDSGLQRLKSLVPDAGAAIGDAEVVVHLAAPNEIAFKVDPQQALEETVEASRCVAGACSASGVRRLIYVSTVHVYGSALLPGAVVTEDTSPAPFAEYGRSRLLSEDVMLREASNVQVVILRLTNGVGSPASPSVDRWTLVGNDLCKQAVVTGRLRLANPGQWRDFIPLDAVTEVILDASDPSKYDVLPSGVYNLSAGYSITVLDLATLVEEEARRMGIPVSIDAPAADRTPPYKVENKKLKDTGLLRDDLSLLPAVRDTLKLCAGAAEHV